MDFQYKVSVIVPVYNVEEYLRDCLDSLVAQTIRPGLMEVLLINDGSADGSLEICNEYAEQYEMFKVFTQENAGPAAARNLGIAHAEGKFILFLDSDDRLIDKSVENITNFFNEVYDKVDLVTYPIYKYDENWKRTSYYHYRYNFLKKNGVYDLEEYPYITQTTMNICVKNKFGENRRFEIDTDTIVHEDQKYISQVLREKMKIGFCKDAEYMYLVREGSIMSTHENPIELWEPTITYYESLFNQFDYVPPYYQGMFIHDVNWKLKGNVLFPYHYEGERFDEAISRLSALMDRIDIGTIMNHPSIDKFHKYYLLSFRKKPLLPIIDFNSCQLYCDGKNILSEKSIEVIVRRIKILDEKFLRIYGSIKSPIFSFIEKPRFYAEINNGKYEEVDLSISGSSWYKSKTRTNTFWAFIFEYDISKISTLKFKVEMDGIYLNTRFWFDRLSPFRSNLKLSEYVLGDYVVGFSNNTFNFSFADDEKKQAILAKNEAKYKPEINEKRKFYMSSAEHQKEIWLYYDNYTVDYDNGYLQFMHDFEKQDGIERYYICEKDLNDVRYLFEEKHLNNIISFGSEQHKILYLNASKIFTAFIEHFSITPFLSDEEVNYIDLFNAEVIYLQHGVMHACIPWYYRPEMVENDRIVISSYFEQSNLVENCGYQKKDLIPSGMPRYDRINRNSTSVNRIVFAPSWRDYLVGKFTDSGVQRESFDNKLLNSNYYNNIMTFLNNKKLQQKLKEKDLYLDLKLHPNFYETYSHLLDFDNERIKLIEGNNKVNLEDYKMFITDFSSFLFDYAYLSRPIVYFIPDYVEFKSGMNRYRELYIPFEKAFGNLTTDPESAADEVIRIIDNDFVTDPVFKERMDNFYLSLDDCAEQLYQYLKNDK